MSVLPKVLVAWTVVCLARPAAAANHRTESLAAFGGRYGFPPPVVTEETLTLQSAYSTLRFGADSRKLAFNGVSIWLHLPVRRHDGDWRIAIEDVATTLRPLLQPRRFRAVRPSVVVLDPGHGGRDAGAIGAGGLLEKTVVLDLARRVERKLRGSGLKVRLTRKRDRTLDLRARTTLAAKWGGGLFVSVHLNASVNRNAAGIETYALAVPGLPSTASDTGDPTPFPGHAHNSGNLFLAYCLHGALLTETGAADRGIRRARFQVLRNAPCPAALVECGFVSNRIEESRLATAVFRDKIAEAIARGIRAYVNRTAPGGPGTAGKGTADRAGPAPLQDGTAR